MSGQQATMEHSSTSFRIASKIHVALIAAGVLGLFLVAYGANREIAQDLDRQVTQEERAFCVRLGLQTGPRYDSCLQEVSRLVQRTREIQAVEF